MKRQPNKIYVAMSGGVDSSVAAALLKKQGYEVIGVFMKPWQPEAIHSKPKTRDPEQIKNSGFNLSNQEIQSSSLCLWRQDREDAMRAAAALGIPLLTWDFSKEYKKEVADYMIREYRAGLTPNPDVMCNKHIKFGLFLKRALREGADFIATGHYVRLRKSTSFKDVSPRYSLSQAKDKNKDQSYFLWTLTQKQLKYCMFPVGNYAKPEIRRMAKKFGLPNHDKKDSQGVCFIGPLDMKSFLQKYIKPRMGKIIDSNGAIVGRHDGTYYYTIGQRHGLNIGNGRGPYFVTGKDLKKNIIYVANKKTDQVRSERTRDGRGKMKNSEQKILIAKINWINERPELPAKLDVKIRYRSESIPALLNVMHNTKYVLRFLGFAKAVTPGQSAVFYQGEEMIGGGIINSAPRSTVL